MKSLDRDVIFQELEQSSSEKLRYLTVLAETDSTNSALMRLPEDLRHAHVIIAELQTGGRGRRQRRWHSPPGGNIYFSLGWQFQAARVRAGESSLASLPLVVAVSLCQSLERLGLREHGIKWPNDILVDGKKLAGVLVEMQSSGEGPLLAVIGVGLNVDMPGGKGSAIDQPWTDLGRQMGAEAPERNRAAACLIEGLLASLEQFATAGLDPIRAEWERRDLLKGKRISVDQGGQSLTGMADGIDAEGALRVVTAGGGRSTIHAGEVSVRHA